MKCISIYFRLTSGDVYYNRVDFHFVSNEGNAVEAELNMPRGPEWNRCLIFRGKQTHTGSRHGCHISLNSAVTPQGRGQGQPLRRRHASLRVLVQGHGFSRQMPRTYNAANRRRVLFSVKLWHPSWDPSFDLPWWKATDLVLKRVAPFLTFPDWSVIVLAPSGCIALHQRAGGLEVFNSISGYPCCCSFWQTNSCHQH